MEWLNSEVLGEISLHETQPSVWETEDAFLARWWVTSRKKGKCQPSARIAGGRHFICVRLIQEHAWPFLDKTTTWGSELAQVTVWKQFTFRTSLAPHIPNLILCCLKLWWHSLLTSSTIHCRSLSYFSFFVIQTLISQSHTVHIT